jgi:hypothetical protein
MVCCGHPTTTGVPARVQRDTQYYATSPEPVSLHNISSSISCVNSYHNVHMCTLNKVSTLLPLVLITSYFVGTSTTYLDHIKKKKKFISALKSPNYRDDKTH